MKKSFKKPLLLTVTAAALWAHGSVCFAADLYGSYKDGPPPAFVNWSGFYAGVNAGGVINNGRTNYSYGYAPGNLHNNFAEFFGSAADNAGGSTIAGPLNINRLNAVQSAQAEGFLPVSLGSFDNAGFIGGGQIGYNWQFGSFVIGAETGLDWIGKSSSHSFSETIPGAYTNSGGDKSSVEWLGTVKLKAGYALDRLLPYVMAGFAYGEGKASSHSVGYDGSTYDNFSGSSSSIRTGWVAGGGLDYWLGAQWTLRVEGFYYDLGTANYAVSPQDTNSASEGLNVTAHHTFDGAAFRVGLNHSF